MPVDRKSIIQARNEPPGRNAKRVKRCISFYLLYTCLI